ncbi:MAG: hypothetical protein L0Y54_06690 [Sporichthyaceae bacterium]|nr:hypothetical protein [Sporichthyaceae bacterium]
MRSLAADLVVTHSPAGKTVTACLLVPDNEPIFQRLHAETRPPHGEVAVPQRLTRGPGGKRPQWATQLHRQPR